MAYGTEAMILVKFGSSSYRAINFDEVGNKEGLQTNIELIDEVRDQAIKKMEKHKKKTRDHISKNTRAKKFQVGNLVLCDIEASDPANTES